MINKNIEKQIGNPNIDYKLGSLAENTTTVHTERAIYLCKYATPKQTESVCKNLNMDFSNLLSAK